MATGRGRPPVSSPNSPAARDRQGTSRVCCCSCHILEGDEDKGEEQLDNLELLMLHDEEEESIFLCSACRAVKHIEIQMEMKFP